MEPQYPGLDEDKNGGMTYLGQIVKDAWVFGLLPETERCAGWSRGQMQALYHRLTVEWDKYGNIPSQLPSELRQRHARIYSEAMERARQGGWDPELGEDD